MTQKIVTRALVTGTGWQALERTVLRLLRSGEYDFVRLAGGTGDGGADVTGTRAGRRWLFQVKRWRARVGVPVIQETLRAMDTYGAEIPVIVSVSGFDGPAAAEQRRVAQLGIPLQLWDFRRLERQAELVPDEPLAVRWPERYDLRDYQRAAVERIMGAYLQGQRSALVVLATGLGKTYVAAEFFRRVAALKPFARTLVLAHRNELVYQLEQSYWPMLRASQSTSIWNGYEKPDNRILATSDVVFACVDTVAAHLTRGGALPEFSVVVVDECHHIGGDDYERVLGEVSAGEGGTFLLGMTATPWRPDGKSLDRWFDRPVVDIDLVRGLRDGYLANVDYRMFTDNIDWSRIAGLHGDAFSPRAINRKLFIEEWDDAVVERLAEAWSEQQDPKCIVFCGTIEHAERMAAKVRSLGFTVARVIASKTADGAAMAPAERSRLLWDFAEGRVGVLCAVDVLNEGVDVPDVNIVVFQRVTHSRRIFVQQLGRGLRLAPNKERVIVLDFVSDIRRFAAGLELRDALGGVSGRVRLGSRVTFRRASAEDAAGAAFLKEWLGDLEAVEEAGEDVAILRYPPELEFDKD